MPLAYRYAMTPLHETLEELVDDHQARSTSSTSPRPPPWSARPGAARASNMCDRAPSKEAIPRSIGDFRFAAGFGKTLSRLVRHGIGVHHAGMLPKYRRLVETARPGGPAEASSAAPTRWASASTCRSAPCCSPVCPSSTAQGARLRAREFHQIAGRAGRAGSTRRLRRLQAPEHVIENEKATGQDATMSEAKRQRGEGARKKPPEGSVGVERADLRQAGRPANPSG